MPGSIRKYNNAGTEMVMQLTRRRDGKLSQHVFGGQFGLRGIRGVLKEYEAAYRILR